MFAHAVYLSWHENHSTMFNGELFQQFQCDTYGVPTAHFAGELEL